MENWYDNGAKWVELRNAFTDIPRFSFVSKTLVLDNCDDEPHYTGIYDHTFQNMYHQACNVSSSCDYQGENITIPNQFLAKQKTVEPIYFRLECETWNNYSEHFYYLPTSDEDYEKLIFLLYRKINVKNVCLLISLYVFGD